MAADGKTPPTHPQGGGAGTLCVHVVSLCADTKTMTCRPCLDTYIHTYKQTINQYKQIVIIHKSIETYSYTYTWLQMVRPPNPPTGGGAGTLCVHVVSLCADTKTMTCRPCWGTYIHTYKQTINQYKHIVIPIHGCICVTYPPFGGGGGGVGGNQGGLDNIYISWHLITLHFLLQWKSSHPQLRMAHPNIMLLDLANIFLATDHWRLLVLHLIHEFPCNSALGWRMAYSAQPRPHMFISSLQIIERRRLKSTSIVSEASNGAKWHCFGVNFSPSFCFSSLRSLASSLCSFWLSLANKSAGCRKKSLVFVPLLLLGDLLPTIEWLCQPCHIAKLTVTRGGHCQLFYAFLHQP